MSAVPENISPSPEQSAAIKQIVEWYGERNRQEFYLAGYAGVGKSTIANIAIEEIKEKYGISKVKTAAYTGKAASVMRRKGIKNAQTIHSLIYMAVVDEHTGEVSFVLSEESDANKAELIVIDECSLADEGMAKDLRSFNKKILVMGDPGQLPPIKGQGAFTSREPDVFLQEIHRQAADSPILELATLARQGKPLPRNYEKGNVRVLPLTKESQELVYNPDTQVICGLNRVRWTYNQRIRKRLGYEGPKPVVGERLICCKNNRFEGIFNGGLGTLEALTGEANRTYKIDIQMDDVRNLRTDLEVDPFHFNNNYTGGESKKIEWKKGQRRLEEFDFGYLLTAHKAQGSQFPHVTVIDDSASFREMRNCWAYTAVTRAESGLTLLIR